MPKAQLIELYARGLGVIEEARVEFGPAFNVLTGETGAGKTLLLGALELCLGGEASSSRYAVGPDTRAVALFSLDDGTEVLLAREASPAGRLRATLGGVPSSADLLRQSAARVIVIHGQHDSLSLRSRPEVLRIIDAAGGIRTDDLDDVRHEITALTSERLALGGDASSRERERDYLTFQRQELADARLDDPLELASVLEDLARVSALRDAQGELLAVIEQLDGDSDQAVLSLLAHAIVRLPRGAGVDDLKDDLSELLESARADVHELTARVQPEHFDAETLDTLESRAALLQQVSRKYGGSLEAAMRQRDEISARIEQLDATEERLVRLDSRLVELNARQDELAALARQERESAGRALTERIRGQLPRVALPHATLRFVVEGTDGSDVQILFAPNPGWPEGPLQSLASGGELSRVLLALSLETVYEGLVAVFDEVDAGVGGQVAQQIGECLREVGATQQVIAVTHLASVAAKATHHFVIQKTVAHGSTTTTVCEVTGEARVREIARMLAGDALSEEAHALARRLLESVI